MENLLGDTRYALRNLLRRPTFTLIAVVTLALGIGANTAIFSAINALLLKPLAFPELDRVVAIWDRLPSRGVMHNEVTVANYLDWQSQSQSFEQLAVGVPPTDLLTFSLVSICLLVAAFVACYLPARRATKVDPLVALRMSKSRVGTVPSAVAPGQPSLGVPLITLDPALPRSVLWAPGWK
jgi:hypothetical protein